MWNWSSTHSTGGLQSVGPQSGTSGLGPPDWELAQHSLDWGPTDWGLQSRATRFGSDAILTRQGAYSQGATRGLQSGGLLFRPPDWELEQYSIDWVPTIWGPKDGLQSGGPQSRATRFGTGALLTRLEGYNLGACSLGPPDVELEQHSMA